MNGLSWASLIFLVFVVVLLVYYQINAFKNMYVGGREIPTGAVLVACVFVGLAALVLGIASLSTEIMHDEEIVPNGGWFVVAYFGAFFAIVGVLVAGGQFSRPVENGRQPRSFVET